MTKKLPAYNISTRLLYVYYPRVWQLLELTDNEFQQSLKCLSEAWNGGPDRCEEGADNAPNGVQGMLKNGEDTGEDGGDGVEDGSNQRLDGIDDRSHFC